MQRRCPRGNRAHGARYILDLTLKGKKQDLTPIYIQKLPKHRLLHENAAT